MTNTNPQNPETRGSSSTAWVVAAVVALVAIIAVVFMVTNQNSGADPAEVARAQDLGHVCEAVK